MELILEMELMMTGEKNKDLRSEEQSSFIANKKFGFKNIQREGNSSQKSVAEILQDSRPLVYPDLEFDNQNTSTAIENRPALVKLSTPHIKNRGKLRFDRSTKNGEFCIDAFILEAPSGDNCQLIDAIVQRMVLLGHLSAAKLRVRSALRILEKEVSKSEDPTLPQTCKQEFAAVIESIESWINDHPSFNWIAFGLLLALAFFWLFAGQKVFSFTVPELEYIGVSTVIYLILMGAFFLLIALDLQTAKQEMSLKAHEKFHHTLNRIQSTIVQVNLSVLSNNKQISQEEYDKQSEIHTMPPEGFIRHVDEVLGTKEAVSSLLGIITARIKTIDTAIKHHHREQQQSRRKIMAAGGAFFVSFALFEIIESVAHHHHLKEKEDANSLLHYLLQKNQLQQNADKTTPALQSHNIGATEYNLVQSTPDAFDNSFHPADLSSSAWVLLITLIVTVVIMLLSFRNATSEGELNHKHHE